MAALGLETLELRLVDQAEYSAQSELARAQAKAPRWGLAAWWPMLLAPLGIAAVYAARAVGWEILIEKAPHEIAALIILSAALLVCGVRWLIRRDRLHLVLTASSAALLCREIHFAGTHRGIYVAAGLIALWCVLWWRSLKKLVWRTAKGRWLTAAVWSYFVAVLVQRRAMKLLPDEEILHVRMEEVCENVAHLVFLIAALI